MNNNKIYIGNLPYTTTEDDLRETFGQYGEIQEVKLITDRETGRSKGFAFVTFTEESAMEAAFEKNGQELGGRTLRVNKAEEKRSRA